VTDVEAPAALYERRGNVALITINRAETELRRNAAWEAVKPAMVSLKKGQKVIGDGELITNTHLLTVTGMRAQTDELDVPLLASMPMPIVYRHVAKPAGAPEFHKTWAFNAGARLAQRPATFRVPCLAPRPPATT